VTSLVRIVRAGLAATLAALVVGWAIERARFGGSDTAALERVQNELRDRLDGASDTLAALAARVRATPESIRAAPRGPGTARALFDEVSAALRDQAIGLTGITVYGVDGSPIAWAGRVFDLPKERLDGPASVFVAPGAFGPRLVRTQRIVDRDGSGRGGSITAGTIVVEQSLGADTAAAPDGFVLSTSLAPITVRARVEGAPPPSNPSAFRVSSRRGGLVVEAEISTEDLHAARLRWRRGVRAVAISILAFTVLLCAGPVAEMRRRAWRGRLDASGFLTYTLLLAALAIAALALALYAARNSGASASPTSPPALLLLSTAALSVVALALDVIERRRAVRRRRRLLPGTISPHRLVLWYLAAGAAGALALAAYERLLRGIVANTSLDVLHFSLHPLGAGRLAVAFGLVLLHAAAIWTAVAIARVAATFVRVPRSAAARTLAIAGWVAGALVAIAIASRWRVIPIGPLTVAVAAAGLCAIAVSRVERTLRHASQAARLGVFFGAMLVPALAMYPSLFAFAISAKEQLVAEGYGPEASSQREDLQRRLQQAIEQIDNLPSLADLVAESEEPPTADRAFLVWSRTDLAKYRLTSAVELYGANGGLVSRFALHLPEYNPTRAGARSCAWEDLFDEVSPFGSSERHVLRTSRAICERSRVVGSIVVRAMLDYRTLPFISRQSPYLGSLQRERQPLAEGASGSDVEFAMYGWSRAPIIESGSTVWRLPDVIFNRLVQSRDPFWATLDRDDDTFRVYFLSDRGAIYALGYPVVSWLGHVINLAELALLTGVLYVIVLIAATIFSALTARTPATGRALLREVRSSFYRKLFLAYVAGAVVPVVVLAFAIRTYFTARLIAGGEEQAQRTVTTAQRLVEDYAAIQQAGSTGLNALDDQSMVLVWRAVDEDVNLFQRARLQATSARDLFASSLLSTRTPGDVYKNILIDRAPTFVGDETVGDVAYRLAAAPVRAGGRDGIVTVPLTNRQNEIEEQIDELDRRVRSASVLFILLGAAIGYWMAERIADPVNRLTRATRRIARGDLDARIATTSSDELRRLVEDFNQMAADLQRQRRELERTQRLEAWAEMARQVAHDIKNPLTPIQLSAEHALRVNEDRGRPLSPVLDDCVNAILAQVRLLRQISAEFSSFASSPKPRPEPTSVPALVEEVVEPYRLGLAGRIAIDVQSAADGAVAVIDRTLFSRALTNIIENALHAMPGSGRLSIRTRLHRATSGNGGPSEIVVEITDTGIGMDREALAKIFEPYFSTKATGTGLGLTIAKRNIELNGGRVDVRSERGVGTTVTVTVPIAG